MNDQENIERLKERNKDEEINDDNRDIVIEDHEDRILELEKEHEFRLDNIEKFAIQLEEMINTNEIGPRILRERCDKSDEIQRVILEKIKLLNDSRTEANERELQLIEWKSMMMDEVTKIYESLVLIEPNLDTSNKIN